MDDFVKKVIRRKSILYVIARSIWRAYYDVFLLNFVGFCFRIFPVRKKKIVVCSFFGRGYCDNCSAVIDELLKISRKEGLEVEIIWAVDRKSYNNTKLPQGVKKTKYKSWRYLWHLVTAKIWLDNARKMFVPPKRKDQVYFQLWHGSIMLKKVEKDATTLPERYIKYAKLDSKNADYFVSGSKFTTKKFKDAFWYDGTVLEYGTPRADILMKTEKYKEISDGVRKELHIRNEKLLLYAPTFRADGLLDAYNLDYVGLISTLEKKYGGKWKILVRLHPNIAKRSKELGLSRDYIIDASNYPDIEDLYIVSDICITDYSSVMFEYSYLKRPVFLYASDVDNYLDDRGFYFDIKKLPYPLAQNNEELKKNILDFSEKRYQERLSSFFEKIELSETGKASEIVAKKITDILEKGV